MCCWVFLIHSNKGAKYLLFWPRVFPTHQTASSVSVSFIKHYLFNKSWVFVYLKIKPKVHYNAKKKDRYVVKTRGMSGLSSPGMYHEQFTYVAKFGYTPKTEQNCVSIHCMSTPRHICLPSRGAISRPNSNQESRHRRVGALGPVHWRRGVGVKGGKPLLSYSKYHKTPKIKLSYLLYD